MRIQFISKIKIHTVNVESLIGIIKDSFVQVNLFYLNFLNIISTETLEVLRES